MPDPPPNGLARTRGAEEPPAGDDQGIADSEQTLADSDQALTYVEQASADNDQWAADSDQAASDRDLASGVDSRAHDHSRDVRQRTALRRVRTAHTRLAAADKRDEIAHARDLAALRRDHAADARDRAMAQDDAAHEPVADGRPLGDAEAAMRAAEQRDSAAQHRAQAAQHRALTAQDRHAAARDREGAAAERRHALADRQALAHQLAIAETDPLTGARTRAAGLTELDHELDRCRRTTGLLVVAYVDVVGLKALNDAEGHGAGDELLKRVVTLIKERLRSYDLIIRLGGDEFLIAMSNMSLPDARRRFSTIADALATGPHTGAISAGFVELAPDETAAELIARADSEMMDSRRADQDLSRR